MFRRIPWQDVCKFLAGAFFVNAGILFYLYLARVSVPLLGTNFIETPEISGMRSIVHAALFLTLFYLGFIRKWKRHSITTYDQDNEKIREVVTTWMRATAGGDLEKSQVSSRRTRFSSCRISRRCEDEKLLPVPSVRPLDKSASKASPIFRRFMSLETTPFAGISYL